ncbi:MAG TPA: hypothetical protein H9716_10890 [Candidatus Enterocloster faecavium]|uniref:VWFA domain-containing protein n=1 Tax=Candidatus Enterocloster faecavium TaxID=2838560 RepID=A0A9D2RM31_9FIRM|nr:hypothetical protein [Candidatus Enterocloster faecavium]
MKQLARRMFRLAGALAMALVLTCGQAIAAPSAQPVRVFVYENTLYTYVKLEGVESPITQVEARIGGQSFPASGRLETVRQAGFPITYLLLVDNSTSMPPFRQQLEEFCDQLAADSGVNTRFILATFGDSFQILNEDATAETMGEQIGAIPFDEDVTRLHTCINSALDYFETLPRQGNELRAMIVITDAVQYDPQGGVPYEELLDRISHSDVMVHSLGMGTDAAALESLRQLTEASGGIHQVAGDSLTPAAAADALSEAGGELMVTAFDLEGCEASGEAQPVSFTFASGGTLLCRGEAKVDLLGEGQTVDSSASESASEEQTQEETEGETSGGETESGPAEKEKSQPPAGASSGAVKESPSGGMSWIGAGIGAAIVLVVILVLILRRRGKAAVTVREETAVKDELLVKDETPVKEDVPSGIYVRVKADEGVLATGNTEFTLSGELTVGRDAGCGLVLTGEDVPPKALLIFLEQGFVTAKPLDLEAQIQVNGETLKEVKRLRSGDTISIAGKAFQLMF